MPSLPSSASMSLPFVELSRVCDGKTTTTPSTGPNESGSPRSNSRQVPRNSRAQSRPPISIFLE
jgi:hypothetical protein